MMWGISSVTKGKARHIDVKEFGKTDCSPLDTSRQNIGQHISNILKEGELDEISVVKNYFITAADADKPCWRMHRRCLGSAPGRKNEISGT
jgi:hypothetical protein